MKRTGKFFQKLEKKSSKFLTINQLIVSAVWISETFFKGRNKKAIIFCNNRNYKLTKKSYYFRLVKKLFCESVVIYSPIVPKANDSDIDSYWVVYVSANKNYEMVRVPLKKLRCYNIYKIISGGQTGADQGGLFAGKTLKIGVGGYAPANYLTEKGNNYDLRRDFSLVETDRFNYHYRTEKNVIESDGTILFVSKQSPGSKLTEKCCKKHKKPMFVVTDPTNIVKYKDKFLSWILVNNIRVLNVAGNRESVKQNIARNAFMFLVYTLSRSGLVRWNASQIMSVWLSDSEENIQKYEKWKSERFKKRRRSETK